MDNLSGQTIKGYELLERIGAGGFGAVYRARQTTVGREVAVKIILPGFAGKPDFIRRFEAEAQTVAQLEHLHITPLYDFWRDPSGAYLVMRYLRGGSLRQALNQGPYDLHPAALLLDQVASALALAHRNEIIHRDIKPGNVLLDEDGNAYLADFGIAKVLGELPGDLTEAGPVGSLDYISPEQARSEPVTPQTDIYSLGVMLYEVLAGEHPFPDSGPVDRLYKHLNDPLPQIESFNGEGEGINAVIQKATAKNPAQRYDDTLEMAAAFREAAKLSPLQAGESLIEQLTLREQEVLALIVAGKSNREISQELVVTLSTVKWYVNQIYRKLEVRNRVQAIVRARELSLVIPAVAEEENVVETAGGSISVVLPEPFNPYKGLRAFQPADHRHFFGREELVEKLLGRLSEKENSRRDGASPRFLAVVGPSGSGKSSLVKAGLIPALWRGALPGSERWFVVEMLPGAHPLDELEVALLRVAANQSGNIREQLGRDARGLLRVAGLILPDDDSQLVLVIDQFEELFTLVEREEDRIRFMDLLLEATSGARSRVRVVVTMRADFYDRPLHYPEFGELLRANMETILPLSARGLTRAIQRPSELVGVDFEEGLVPTIVEEIHYQAGALPLLQYALTELFERRQGRTLTRQAYQEMGGTVGALAKRAEEIYRELSVEMQEALRQMFLRLVTLGEGVEDTRRRVPRSELLAISPQTDVMDEVIDTLAAYRLLSLDNDPTTRAPTVEVAHEAILREWERLRGWLNDSRADIRLQRQLGRAAGEWKAAEKDPSFLLRGGRLAQFETWKGETGLRLTPVEEGYLEASLAARAARQVQEAARLAREERLELRSRNFLRALVGVFAVATVVAVLLSVYAFMQQDIAQAEAEGRATAQIEAELAAERADDNAATAQAETQARATQQTIAEENEALAEQEKAIAESQRARAETEALLAFSRELSQAALLNLGQGSDPELSLLLALQALETKYTRQAEEALRTSIQASRLRQTFPGYVLALDQSGATLATADEDTIWIWELASGKEHISWNPEQGGPISMIALSPDGSLLASGAEDGSLKIFDAGAGVPLLDLVGHSGLYNSRMSFSPDGARLASANSDGSLRVWDIAGALRAGRGTEEAMMVIDSGLEGDLSRYNHTILFHPDGERLITSGDDLEGVVTKVWDIASGDLESTLPEIFPAGLGLSPDGRYIADWDYSAISVYELDSFVGSDLHDPVIRLPNPGAAPVNEIIFSPDGNRIMFSYRLNETTLLWDLSAGAAEQPLSISPTDWLTVFHPNGEWILTNRPDGTIAVWDVSPRGNREVLTLAGHQGQVEGVAYSPDGATLATSGWDGTARIWDARNGDLLATLEGHSGIVWNVAFSPDGATLATAGADNTTRVWDAETGAHLITIRDHEEARPVGLYANGILKVAFSPNGELLATAGAEAHARLWDTATWEQVAAFPVHPESRGATSVAFTPDGTRLITASDICFRSLDNGCDDSNYAPIGRVWDVESGEEISSFPLPERAFGLAFNRTGTRLATTTFSGSLLVWDTSDPQEYKELFSLGDGSIGNALFSPDGTRLYTAGDDLPHVWDLAQREHILTFPGHENATFGLALSPDGRYLATGSYDGTARIYTLELSNLMDLARTRISRWFTLEECREFLHVETCPPAPWASRP